MNEPFTKSESLKQIERFVANVYKSKQPKLPFHTLARARKNLTIINQLSASYRLSPHERFVLRASGWFQGIGFVIGEKDFLKSSAATAQHFLLALGISKNTIDEIQKAISVTSAPQRASGVVQFILCDAVFFYLSERNFKKQHKRLRLEEELSRNYKIDKMAWLDQSITLLKTHRYCSGTVESRLGQSRSKNLEDFIKAKDKYSNAHNR